MTSRPSTAAPILAILAIVLVTLLVVLYPLGYFFHCQVSWLVPPQSGRAGQLVADAPAAGPSVLIRVYPTDYEAILFLPGTYLETIWWGSGVRPASPSKLF